MYLGQAMGICPGLMNFQTFDTSGTPYNIYIIYNVYYISKKMCERKCIYL